MKTFVDVVNVSPRGLEPARIKVTLLQLEQEISHAQFLSQTEISVLGCFLLGVFQIKYTPIWPSCMNALHALARKDFSNGIWKFMFPELLKTITVPLSEHSVPNKTHSVAYKGAVDWYHSNTISKMDSTDPLSFNVRLLALMS